jgi:hypothetical protein
MSSTAEPKAKRVKSEPEPEPAPSSSEQPAEETSSERTAPSVNEQGEEYFELSAKKRFTVRKWKGNVLLDIREFYEDKKSEEMRPGKKGISLTNDQYKALKALILDGSIDEIVTKNGGEV